MGKIAAILTALVMCASCASGSSAKDPSSEVAEETTPTTTTATSQTTQTTTTTTTTTTTASSEKKISYGDMGFLGKEPAVIADGDYNEETRSVHIQWITNIEGETEVFESENGKDFKSVSKLAAGTNEFNYTVVSDFEKKYFKVCVAKDDKSVESIPFIIVRTGKTYTRELLDTDKDGLADIYEQLMGTDKTKPDTDNDGLTDYQEVMMTGTDPTTYDSVTPGVSDAQADNDKDGLTNKQEVALKTDPNDEDTDGDGLSDGDEVNKYKTDPLKRDTDGDGLDDDDEIKFKCDPLKKDSNGNGILDGDEKRQQVYEYTAKNEDSPVKAIIISANAAGNIEKTLDITDIMDRDYLCSNVVGLVGEPFEIENSSDIDKMTVTFGVDKSKLGDTKFEDLMFLWYDAPNDNFQELKTKHDSSLSTVSVDVTNTGKYMLVNQETWFEAWRQAEELYEYYHSLGLM